MAITQAVIGVKRSGRAAWLEPAAAASYKRMLEDGCPAGGITDAGRTYAEQQSLWNAYLAGRLVATAAYPGTSKHETGRALDLAEPARAWVRTHGHRYGWIKDRVRNEPWHMEYDLTRDTQIGRGTEPTQPAERDWFDMATKQEIREAFEEALEPLRQTVTEINARTRIRMDSNSSDDLAQLRALSDRLASIEAHLKVRLNSNTADTLNVARAIRDQQATR